MALIGVLALMVGGLRTARPQAPSVPRPVAETMVVHVQPVDDQGRLGNGFQVTDTVRGATCYGPSVKVVLTHSCSAGHYIYDPCWTETDGPSGPSVLCLIEPWSPKVDRLLTETDVAPEPPTPDYDEPGWVQLVDGQRCRVSTGAHGSLDPAGGREADVVDYSCGKQLGLVLLRGIDKTHPVWTANAARYAGRHFERTGPQSIATAWI